MTIIEKLAQSIHDVLDIKNAEGEVVRPFPFYYDTPQTLNVRLDNANFPCAFLHVIESGTADDTNGILRERIMCQVMFANLTVLDFDGLENERIIDALKRIAFVWLQGLRKSQDLRLASNIRTRRLYASEDAILTVFGVTITVEEIDGISPCDVTNEEDFDIPY